MDVNEELERDETAREQDAAPGTTPQEQDVVTVESKALESVTAETVHIQSGGAQSVQATTVHVAQGGIAAAKAETITVQEGGIAIARGTNVAIHGGGAFLVAAEHAEVENGPVVLLAAREVGGEVKVLFDVKAALLFGLAMGVVVGLLRRLPKRKE
jgi:hypothetical protein